MTLEMSLRHSFPGFDLALDASLGAGVTALFGPSGSGKTTVLKMVAGLLRPDEGWVQLEGRVLLDTRSNVFVRPARRRIAVVFQDARLFPHMSVRRNLRYGAWRGRRSALMGFDDLVDLLGLEPLLSRRPATLSGGEAQRVALGRALLSNPELILMDEPLSALDQRRKEEVLPYFERLRDHTPIPILYVSHDVSEVARLADTVILLEDGESRAVGPVSEVFSGEGMSARDSRELAGAILDVWVVDRDDEDGLTEVRLGDSSLWVPGFPAETDQLLRLRIDARDVFLMLDEPRNMSALNTLPVTVVDVREGPGAGALVRLDHDGYTLVARITRRSVRELNLTPGLPLFAVLKSMSVAGDHARPRDFLLGSPSAVDGY